MRPLPPRALQCLPGTQGTFTDVCVITPDGDTIRAKTPTTSPDQSIGVQNGIAKARKMLRAQYGWDGEFSYIHHGSTIGKRRPEFRERWHGDARGHDFQRPMPCWSRGASSRASS